MSGETERGASKCHTSNAVNTMGGFNDATAKFGSLQPQSLDAAHEGALPRHIARRDLEVVDGREDKALY